MMREKEYYREQLGLLREMYPGRVSLSVEETAAAIGKERRAVIRLIKRRANPLPAQDMGTSKKSVYSIPLTALANFMAGGKIR